MAKKNENFDLDEILSELKGNESGDGEDDTDDGEESTSVVKADDAGLVDDHGQNNEMNEFLDKLCKEFSEMRGQIWSKVNEDREKIDHFINLFTQRIEDATNTKSVYVESITSLLQTKANTSMNASKMLDSVAKMVSAAKNMPTSDSGLELDDILNDDGYDDEEP